MPSADQFAGVSADDVADRPVAAPKLGHSARRINKLAEALAAERYLEIGVAAGVTFLRVTIPLKTAVDPKFRFDWQSLRDDTTEFHQTNSDDWFIHSAAGRKFDIIFIDGLHTFEQTFRDFCNTLAVAHDRTVWLIDDTVPSDVYSAWPDEREAKENRRRAVTLVGGDQNARLMKQWHGDVFKTVFAIHDFFPLFSFCTIVKDNPQTLVWRAPRENFKPLFNNLETISRLNFFDLQRHFALLESIGEDEGLERVIAALRSEPPPL